MQTCRVERTAGEKEANGGGRSGMIRDLASGTLEARATLVTCRMMPAPRRESDASPFWKFFANPVQRGLRHRRRLPTSTIGRRWLGAFLQWTTGGRQAEAVRRQMYEYGMSAGEMRFRHGCRTRKVQASPSVTCVHARIVRCPDPGPMALYAPAFGMPITVCEAAAGTGSKFPCGRG